MDQYKEAREYLKKKELEESKKTRAERAMERQLPVTTDTEIKESFRWLTPEIKAIIPIGKNKVRIKGVAARSNVVSKNKRMYLEKELIKSVNSLIGAPITVNHNPNLIVGNVEMADWEDNELEYVGQVNKQPYVDYLKNRDEAIKGVSMDADYLYMKCVKCGEKFFDEKLFQEHMSNEHLITNGVNAPHGIKHKGLSLVVSPEQPGIESASIELLETKQNGLLRLAETIIKEKGYGLQRSEKIMGISRSTGLEGLKLGEPFADYKDFADCVSQNQDKENPEAYCASIKQQVEEQEEQPQEIPKCEEGTVYNPDTKQCEPIDVERAKELLENLNQTFAKGTKAQLRFAYETILGALDQHYRFYKEQLEGDLLDKLNTLEGLKQFIIDNFKAFDQRLEKLEKLANPTLQETEQLVTRVDNLEAKLRGQFKGHSKPIKSEADYADPEKEMRDAARKKR